MEMLSAAGGVRMARLWWTTSAGTTSSRRPNLYTARKLFDTPSAYRMSANIFLLTRTATDSPGIQEAVTKALFTVINKSVVRRGFRRQWPKAIYYYKRICCEVWIQEAVTKALFTIINKSVVRRRFRRQWPKVIYYYKRICCEAWIQEAWYQYVIC